MRAWGASRWPSPVSGCWRRPRSTGWLTGAAAGARGPNRVNHRDGRRERGRGTRVGRVGLATPEPRQGACFPTLPGAASDRREGRRSRRGSRGPARAAGIATRAAGDPVGAMGGTGVPSGTGVPKRARSVGFARG
jgi:mutator family transposase